MENNKHYFLVGIFVILTTIAALCFAVWVSSSDKGDFVHYRIRFAESVSGLSEGGSVKFRGVNVGTVDSIEIDRRDTRLIKVDIKVDKDTPVKADTVASLKLQGITGVVFVELSGGTNEAPDLASLAKDGRVPEIKAKSSPLNAVIDRLPELLDKITIGVERINKMMSDENIAAFANMMARLQEMSVELAKDVKQLDPLLKNSNQTAANMNEITNTSKENIKEAVKNLNQSSQQLENLMRDMRKTSRNVSDLSESLSEDPSRLIFPDDKKGVPAP